MKNNTSDQLFQIPATHRPKLDVWKERYGVITYRIERMAVDDLPWIAARPFEEDAGKTCIELIAESHGLYMNMGMMAYGTTEEAACFEIAEENELPWLESITEADCRLESAATEARG